MFAIWKKFANDLQTCTNAHGPPEEKKCCVFRSDPTFDLKVPENVRVRKSEVEMQVLQSLDEEMI